MDTHPDWVDRTAFAEVAEALGIRTDEILAQVPGVGGVGVLYTVGEMAVTPDGPDIEVWFAVLVRDSDNVLVVHSREIKPGYMAEMNRGIRQRLADEGLS